MLYHFCLQKLIGIKLIFIFSVNKYFNNRASDRMRDIKERLQQDRL